MVGSVRVFLPVYIFFFFIIFNPIFSFEIIESSESVEDLNLKAVKLLNDLTDEKIQPLEKTRGFNYRYSPYWYSPFKFDIYVGKFLKKSQTSLLRIEASRKGEEKFLRILVEDKLNLNREIPEPIPKILPKNHFAAQGLNVLAPYLAMPYMAHKSPLYAKGEILGKMGLYLLVDAVILGLFAVYAENVTGTKSIADRILLRDGPDNLDLLRGQFSGLVFSFLAVPRLIRAVEVFNEVGSQNRYYEFLNSKPGVELSYTVRF